MKHILQWKFIGIMFISLICGITSIAIVEAYFFGNRQGMTAEEAQLAAEEYSVYIDLLFIMVTISVFLILSRKIIKRIENMNHKVEQIALGKLGELASDNRNDELGTLSRNINDMAEKISVSLEKEREMVCNVAHDLRTPVTSIQGYARLLKNNDELSDDNRKYASIIENKSESLADQIAELLDYSILQFEEKEYTFEPLSLTCLIEQVLIEFVPMMDEKHMSFSFLRTEKELTFSCNQLLMVRLFENLFSNCIRYGVQNSDIEVELSENDELLIISIGNYGNALGKEDIEHLFDAFYQGDSSKEYKTQSKGLGLAIAKKIVSIHNGSILAESDQATQKTTFILKFKKKDA